MLNALNLIYLVGMPGSGKSTIGRALARLLGWNFKDADASVEEATGVSISTIFELEGEAGFRKREEKIICALAKSTQCVIATGGGAILSAENRETMRAGGFVVYLRASRDLLAERMLHDKTRPLLQGGNMLQKLDQILTERSRLYEAGSHITIDAGTGDPQRVANEIRRHLQSAGLLKSAQTKPAIQNPRHT